MGRPKKYFVELSEVDREYLDAYLRAGEHSTRLLNRVRILLFSDEGEFGPAWKDEKVAEAVGVTTATVSNIRKKYHEGDIDYAIHRKEYDASNRERKLDGEGEAKLIAMMMGDPPEGRAKWTLRLAADKLVELDIVEDISHEGVRLYLKKIGLNLGTKNHG